FEIVGRQIDGVVKRSRALRLELSRGVHQQRDLIGELLQNDYVGRDRKDSCAVLRGDHALEETRGGAALEIDPLTDAETGVVKHDHLERLVCVAGEVGNLLRRAVFADFEIFRRQIERGVRRSGANSHDDVDQIAVDTNYAPVIPLRLWRVFGQA